MGVDLLYSGKYDETGSFIKRKKSHYYADGMKHASYPFPGHRLHDGHRSLGTGREARGICTGRAELPHCMMDEFRNVLFLDIETVAID